MAEHLALRGLNGLIASVQANITDLRVPIVAGRIVRVDSFIGAPNAAGPFTVDVNKNGATIFGSPAARPNIAAGATTDDSTGLAVAVVRGDIITVDADAVPPGGVSGFYICITFEDDSGLRTTVSYTTAVLAPGATENAAIPLGRSCYLMSVESDFQAWVRFYTRASYRTADAARLIDADPEGEHGVLADLIFTPDLLTIDSQEPVPCLFNLDAGTSRNAIGSVKNTSGVARAIELTFTVNETEK